MLDGEYMTIDKLSGADTVKDMSTKAINSNSSNALMAEIDAINVKMVEITTDYYNKKGVKIDKLPTNEEYEAERAAKKEELENMFDTNYMKYIDDLKYGTFSERLVYHDEETGLDIPYYVYTPDYGRDVTGTPTTLWMHGSAGSEDGWLKNGLTSIVYNKDATPEGTIIMPFIKNHEAKGLTTALKNLTDKVVSETNGDTNKISVTGHSYGGIVTYRMVNDYPDYFAAAIPISGSESVTDAFANTKTWIFCGTSEGGSGNCSYGAAHQGYQAQPPR